MRLLIDENVPDSTAKAFEARGHETIYVRDDNSRARDQAVARIAELRGAIVVTWNVRHFRPIIRKRLGMTRRSAHQMGLIGFRCDESIGAKRVKEIGSLIEYAFSTGQQVSSDSVAVTVTTEEIRSELAFAR